MRFSSDQIVSPRIISSWIPSSLFRSLHRYRFSILRLRIEPLRFCLSVAIQFASVLFASTLISSLWLRASRLSSLYRAVTLLNPIVRTSRIKVHPKNFCLNVTNQLASILIDSLRIGTPQLIRSRSTNKIVLLNFCLSDSLHNASFWCFAAPSNARPRNRLPIPRLRIGFMSVSPSW